MDRADTYQLLVNAISKEMRMMEKPEAMQLASDITAVINNKLARKNGTTDCDSMVERLIPTSVRNLATLTAGWDAYRRTHEQFGAALQRGDQARVICTLPSSLRNLPGTRKLGIDTGIWAGTLMAAIYELINQAEREVIIVAPYWSPSGVASLLRHISRKSMEGVNVIVMTQPRSELRHDELEGVLMLRDALLFKKAEVRILSPKEEEYRAPLLHAKTVVMDGCEAYIGSANYSSSGIEQSFELGIRLKGSSVIDLREWAGVLINNFEEWA